MTETERGTLDRLAEEQDTNASDLIRTWIGAAAKGRLRVDVD